MLGGHTDAILNGMIYIIGGIGTDNVFQYDPSSDTWQTVTPLQTGRDASFTEVASGSPQSIYVIGGIDSKGEILASVEKGTLVEADESSTQAEPSTPPTSEPEFTPEPAPTSPPSPPGTGMGCSQAAINQSASFLDLSPIILGAMVLALVGVNRKRH